jgi:tetrapyrrole methylase family protein/MazG family protein
MADQVQIVDATELQRWVESEPFNGGIPDVSPFRPTLLTQIYSNVVASAAKLALTRVFPEEHQVVVIRASGVVDQQRVETRPLFELDRCAVDHLTSVVVPPLPSLEATKWPATLLNITARLRAPDGCPWDRKQTHSSLRDSGIEEAYEVAEAIDENDPDHLAEELGDLVLLVAMQAQIAEELGTFSIGDVYDHINRKLVRRHPHVFGDRVADTADAVVSTWNEIKAQERASRGAPDRVESADPFDKLPRSMPVTRRIAATVPRTATGEVDKVDVELLGEDLLKIVRRLAALGFDPEAELERAYRRSVNGSQFEIVDSPEDGSVH